MSRARAGRLSLGGWLTIFLIALFSWGQAKANAASCADPLAAEASVKATLSLDPSEIETLRQFYRARGDACGWSDAQIGLLRSVLFAASDQGLDVARYRPDAIDAMPAESMAARDFFASAAALRYAHDMVFGRIDLAGIESDIDVPRPADDLARGLEGALARPDIGSWLASLAPADPAYRRLAEAFRRYRDQPAGMGAMPIAAGPTLRLGDSDPRIIALKTRLRALGDLRGIAAGADFDAATKAALAAFQRRHGLADDGRLGRDTLAALNVPAPARLDQIAVNLERWRYFGHVLSANRIEVNSAAATAQLVKNYRRVLAMRAVVGDRRHASPILVSPAVETIVLNPPWVVPVSIIMHEIEPRLGYDPGYLARNDMHWNQGQLVQSPGPKNSLGRIKFDFPSRFSVYLHDTPARALFARQDRARSHGCIRLERPFDLAVELLKGDPQWTPQRLKAAIDTGATQRLVLATGPQVAVVYWTAFVDEDGTVEFRDDLYGRDARLAAALRRAKLPAGSPPPIALAKIGCPKNRG